MVKIFNVLMDGYRMLKNDPDSVIFEYYEKHRKKFDYSKKTFIHFLDKEFQIFKNTALTRFEKKPNAEYVHVLFYDVTRAGLAGMEDHLNKLKKHWSEKQKTRFDVLVELYKKNGDMTTPKLRAFAVANGHVGPNEEVPGKAFADYYTKHYDDIQRGNRIKKDKKKN
jgi:hypothetical protein